MSITATLPVMNRRRMGVIALGAVILAGGGTYAGLRLTSGPGGPQLTPACSTAVNVAEYILGHNGAQDPSNDVSAQVNLQHAHWSTGTQAADAQAVVSALNPDTGGGAEALNNVVLLNASHQLLVACKPT